MRSERLATAGWPDWHDRTIDVTDRTRTTAPNPASVSHGRAGRSLPTESFRETVQLVLDALVALE